MQEFVIYFPDCGEDHYVLSRDYFETDSHFLTKDVSLAAIFYSQSEASKIFKKSENFKKLIERQPACKNFKVLEIPSKRYGLSPNETLIYNNSYSFFEKEGPDSLEAWEQFAIREIDAKEAARVLADTLEQDNRNPSMYFWDDGIYNGNIRTLLGIISDRPDKYLVRLPMGHYDTASHCGRIRVVNSGYMIPVEINNGIVWVNPRSYLEVLDEKGLTKDQLQPAFETDINLQVFWKKVQELEKYYVPTSKEV